MYQIFFWFSVFQNIFQGKDDIDITLVQYKEWIYNILCPTNVKQFLDFHDEVTTLGNYNEPILIACRLVLVTKATVCLLMFFVFSDGVRASGLFIAMDFLIQQIKHEVTFDVPLAIRTIRTSKDDFVRNLAQVKFLYWSCLIYSQRFNTYDNLNILSL